MDDRQPPAPAPGPDHRPFVPDADVIVDGLPWIVGRTAKQQRRDVTRAAALVSQIAHLLAGGWSTSEIRAILASVDLDGAADAIAQEVRWRKALKAARVARSAAAREAAAGQTGSA